MPLIIAVIVTSVLYLLVMERDMLRALAAGGSPPAPAAAPASGITLPTQLERAPTDTERRVPVLVRESLAQSINNGLVLRGRTEAARMVDVRAETSGRVISEPMRRGAYVNEGDILCELDAGARAAQLAEAEARLADATLSARNAERLSEGGFAAETRAVSARAQLQAAEAGVEMARKELGRLKIAAPFSGLLENDAAELGSLLQPGATCAKITQLDPIRLVGFVAESDIDRVEVGAMGGGRTASGREMVGRVTFVSRSADPATRTFRVELTVPNADLTLRDGQTADILIQTEGVSAHLLPGSAMTLNDQGQIGVRVADDTDHTAFLPIKVINDTAQGLWVTGLPDRIRLIVRGQEYVTEGVALDITLQEPGQ
jgi:membrane fusion protein, multidrug efflux system